MTLKARVRAGRLVVDEPTDLPDGTEIELLPLDPGDWLDDADRGALHAALRESEIDVAADRLVEAHEVLRELKRLPVFLGCVGSTFAGSIVISTTVSMRTT
jgi:hypothetical protein